MFDSPRPANPVIANKQRLALCGPLMLAAAALPAAGAAKPAHHGAQVHAVPHARVGSHAVTAHAVHGSPAHATTRYRAAKATMVSHAQKTHATKDSVHTVASTSHAQHGSAMAPVAKEQPATPTHAAAQQATEDRVHAWYRAQHPGSTSPHEEPAASRPLEARPVALKSAPTAPKTPETQTTDSAPISRISPAALRSDEALHATAAAHPSPTSTEDAAAISEESHIPSTAPTERTATPFTHGDFNLAGANYSASPAAPVLRSSSPAANALLASKPRIDAVPVEVAALGNTPVTTVVNAPAPLRLSPADEDAANAASLVKVNLYDSAGKLILIPPMKGTHEILVHQNQMAQADGLQRIGNDAQLADMRRSHLLVALPETAGIGVDERLPLNRRYARPWSVRFLNDLARAHYARFHTPLIVTSAVRTVAFQRHLVLVNGNAAPPTGDIASPHLYGQAVDIAKHGMSTVELAWMRAYLTPVETEGKIDVEEEFQQACFHISIYRSYTGGVDKQAAPAPEMPAVHTLQQAKATPAKHRRIPTALLAMRLR